MTNLPESFISKGDNGYSVIFKGCTPLTVDTLTLEQAISVATKNNIQISWMWDTDGFSSVPEEPNQHENQISY